MPSDSYWKYVFWAVWDQLGHVLYMKICVLKRLVRSGSMFHTWKHMFWPSGSMLYAWKCTFWDIWERLGTPFESNLGREKNPRAFVGDSLKEKHRKSGTPVLTTPVKENHPDLFPIPQNASWAQNRRTNKGSHNQKKQTSNNFNQKTWNC